MATEMPRGPAQLVLTAWVARRYYLDGRSKVEIADEFRLSRFKVARLLELARASGLVRIDIGYPGSIDVSLSGRLQDAYGLQHAIVVDTSIELVRDVARVAGGPASYFYAPMIVPDATTAAALRRQPEVARAIDRFASVTKAVVGVGGWDPPASTVHDAITPGERRALRRLGVLADVSGVFLADDGTAVEAPLTERIIGIRAAQLHRIPEVIAIAYGPEKAAATRAAIRGGYVTGLVTHTPFARNLMPDG